MDHDFPSVGNTFTSFANLKDVLQSYEKKNNVQFFIRQAKPLEVAINEQNKIAFKAIGRNDLVYHSLTFACARGGRPYVSKSIGLRKTSTWRTGCPSQIRVCLSKCGQFLRINQVNLHHNHELVKRPPKRSELREERRRKRLVKLKKISGKSILKLTIQDLLSNGSRQNEPNEHEENVHVDSKSCTTEFSGEDTAGLSDSSKLSYEKIDTAGLSDSSKLSYEKIDNVYHSLKNSDNVIENFCENNASQNESDESFTQICNEFSDAKKIYTRNGDDGTTYTFNEYKKYKDDRIFEALGTAEELSSAIGYAREFIPSSCKIINTQLEQVQYVLQDLAIHIGTPKSLSKPFHEINSVFPLEHVTIMERWIDAHTSSLPQSSHIILPSGGVGSSALHVARSICRRAERRIVGLVRDFEVDNSTIRYLNRLGDYLFTVARVVCLACNKDEFFYKPPKINQESKGYQLIYIAPQK